MKLLGDWNWYLPERVRRALRLRPARSVSLVALSRRPARLRWRPSASKFVRAQPGLERRARAAGHSPSSSENQAVSRLRPLTIMCWRKTPSNVKPKRSAARRERALAASHFHSRRRLPRSSKAWRASR